MHKYTKFIQDVLGICGSKFFIYLSYCIHNGIIIWILHMRNPKSICKTPHSIYLWYTFLLPNNHKSFQNACLTKAPVLTMCRIINKIWFTSYMHFSQNIMIYYIYHTFSKYCGTFLSYQIFPNYCKMYIYIEVFDL